MSDSAGVALVMGPARWNGLQGSLQPSYGLCDFGQSRLVPFPEYVALAVDNGASIHTGIYISAQWCGNAGLRHMLRWLKCAKIFVRKALSRGSLKCDDMACY